MFGTGLPLLTILSCISLLHRSVLTTRTSAVSSPRNLRHISRVLAGSKKSCLLITPDHGPRVRWVSILTDAPLHPTGSPIEPQCGDCTACVDICPQHAFTGRIFYKDEPRKARFDAAACDGYFREMKKKKSVAVCGLCLYVCPYGRKSKISNRK